MSEENKYRGWSHRDERRLADLVGRGMPREEIAVRLGRSCNAVTARIARLGVAVIRRRGFSAAEDRAIRQGRAAGDTYAAIAGRLGRSEGAVKDRARRLGLAARRGIQVNGGKPAPRKCLKHGGRFQPAHRLEFICPTCKESEDWQAWPWTG